MKLEFIFLNESFVNMVKNVGSDWWGKSSNFLCTRGKKMHWLVDELVELNELNGSLGNPSVPVATIMGICQNTNLYLLKFLIYKGQCRIYLYN